MRHEFDGSAHAGNDQPMQQNSSTINEGGQNALRRNGVFFGLVSSAASAFDAVKDIPEALRSKHAHLASEFEVLLIEIGSRLVTLPEERLLVVVNATASFPFNPCPLWFSFPYFATYEQVKVALNLSYVPVGEPW